MALTRTDADLPAPPFGPAVVKRGLHVHYWVEDPPTTKGGEYVAKDVSGARWTYRLRRWASDDDTTPADDKVIDKGTADSTGELDYYYPCGATVTDAQTWEVVEVDNDNADTDTRTGKREKVLVRWRQAIVDAP